MNIRFYKKIFILKCKTLTSRRFLKKQERSGLGFEESIIKVTTLKASLIMGVLCLF